MPTRRRWSHTTAVPLGRVILFPVPSDPQGQFELFPEPDPPDPHSASMLVIRFTELHIRITKLSTHLSREKRERLIGDYYATLALVEQYELELARQREIDAEAWHRRIA